MNPARRKNAGFNLGETLDAMDQMHKHQSILTFMNYPRTEKLHERDAPFAACNYECESATQCDFSQCFSCIDNHPDLRAFGSQKVLKNIVADLEHYPEDHMSSALDGFQIYRGGIDLIHSIATVENNVPMTNSPTGFLEYNDIRGDTYKWFERQQLMALNAGMNKASRPQCSIQ